MQDRDIQRVYRACDFNTAQLIPPDQAYSDAGNVNSAGRLNLVIESVRPDTKHLSKASACTMPRRTDRVRPFLTSWGRNQNGRR
jgi:hypothetical protein